MAPLPGERVGALRAAAGVLSDMCAAVRTGGGSVLWNAAVSGSRFGAGRRSDGAAFALQKACRSGRLGVARPSGQAQRRHGPCGALRKQWPCLSGRLGASRPAREVEATARLLPRKRRAGAVGRSGVSGGIMFSRAYM